MDTALSLGTLRGRTFVKEAMQLPSDIGGIVLLGLQRQASLEKKSFGSIGGLLALGRGAAGAARGAAGAARGAARSAAMRLPPRVVMPGVSASTAVRATGSNLMRTFGRAARTAKNEAKLFGDFAGRAMKGTADAAARGAQVGRKGLENLSLYGNRTTLRGFRDARRAGLNLSDSAKAAGKAGRSRADLRGANKGFASADRGLRRSIKARDDAARRLEFAQSRGLSDDVVARLQSENAQAAASVSAAGTRRGAARKLRRGAQSRFNTATGTPQPQRLPAQTQPPATPPPATPPPATPPPATGAGNARPKRRRLGRRRFRQRQQQPPPANTPSTPPTEPSGVMDAVARNIRANPLMAAGLAGAGGVGLGALIE